MTGYTAPAIERRRSWESIRRALASAIGPQIPWELGLAAAVALGLALFYLRSVHSFGLPFDDSFISLQFARNLADHGFLTFDGETASAGATSPLHVAMLSIPIKLGIDPVKASISLGILLHVGLVAAVYWLARVIFHDRLAGFLAGVLVGLNGYLAFDALNGMETTLFLLLTTAATAAFLGARSPRGYMVAGALVALAVLTRPEAVLLLASMMLYELQIRSRDDRLLSAETLQRLAALAAPAAAALAALALFYQATTGSLTPGAATAKLEFFREFDRSWQARGDLTQSGVAGFLAPLLPFLALAALAARRREALVFAYFGAGFLLLYLILFPGGLTHYWYRYQHAFLPPLLVFAAGGLAWLIRAIRWRSADPFVALALGAAIAAATFLQYNDFRNHYVDEVTLNETRGVAIAIYLRDTLPPGATIATHDIGDIGYYSGHPVIDLVGLVNPDVVKYHKGRRVREYVDGVRPDYVVLFPSWEFNFLHLALDPRVFETVKESSGEGEHYIVYRTHFGP